MRTVCLLVAAAVLAGAPARARAEDGATAVPVPVITDAGDLWHHVFSPQGERDGLPDPESRKPFFVIAPAIGSKPSTGLNGGFAGNIAFVDGDAASTHLSSVSGGVKVSQKGQTLSGVKFAVFTPDDRWFLQGDNRLSWTSLNTYSLGTSPSSSGEENLKYEALRLHEILYRAIEPGLFIGAGLNVDRHANVRPGAGDMGSFDAAAYTSYSQQHGFALDHQASGGTSLGLLFDTRDNAINARRGWLANATYRTFFDGFLGGASTWQELYLDVRTYRTLTADGRRRLAFWFLGDLVTGGAPPYLDLPETGGDTYGRSARGYSEGRYRGNEQLYGEVEYRDTITRNGLLGYVAFVNTTTIDSDAPGQRLFDAFAPAAGGGLRVLLNKKSRTNLCVDYGWGKQGSHGLYLAIQEAF